MWPDLPPTPAQPDESEWHFVAELRTEPLHKPRRFPPRRPRADEAHFPAGLRLLLELPDPQGRLRSAVEDFQAFQASLGLFPDECSHKPSGKRVGVLTIRQWPAAEKEAHRLTITRDGVLLEAGDTEGVRRGLVFLEDEMLRRGGPFLPLDTIVRRPIIRTRISRCFYGPINRPPKLRDELAEDVDYYPEAYLNRLAHEGVNVLWLTINWYECIPSKIIPEYGQQAGPRLERLRRLVDKCARYGIRIYPFCIEPAGFTRPAPEVQAAARAHPELWGHNRAFCTSTEKGLAYVEEAVRTLFEHVPGLGGLIVIPVGERQTHCYSGGIPDGPTPTPNTCPRCREREPWAVLADTLTAMRRGMEAVAPEAELIAWPYGQFIAWGAEKTIEAAAHMPPGVILQHNFETGGVNWQLGKPRPAWDYWLSYVGPSALFERCARAAQAKGTRISAKLQVGCSHEVATTQFVPVPGLLYRKYRALRRLGVSAAMHSWYFGTYPSLMTKAAGELSFAPFPRSCREFLQRLAQRDWGRYAETVMKAWEWFARAYTQYPTAHIFSYYGPMHDGPAWPLYLIPRRRPLAPTWQLGYPPSGDYIAECVTNGFTLEEIVRLCRRLTRQWDNGLRILRRLRPYIKDQPEREREIGVAEALGLQFRSGFHILRFYLLRERLAETKVPVRKRQLLAEMKELVRREIAVSEALAALAAQDSRLGFHSEAEGYKYYPALLHWRVKQLRRLLAEEFPLVEAAAQGSGWLWADYIGEAPSGPTYEAPYLLKTASGGTGGDEGWPREESWKAAPVAQCTYWLRHPFNEARWRQCGYDGHDHLPVPEEEKGERPTRWQALWGDEAFFLRIECQGSGERVQLWIEPSRTRPRRIFHLSADGSARCQHDDGYIARDEGGWEARIVKGEGGWAAMLRIPWEWLGRRRTRRPKPLRVNILRFLPIASPPGVAECSWIKREPVKGRLVWGDLNPATDFGWLRFGTRQPSGSA